jgi:hypothetical protein
MFRGGVKIPTGGKAQSESASRKTEYGSIPSPTVIVLLVIKIMVLKEKSLEVSPYGRARKGTVSSYPLFRCAAFSVQPDNFKEMETNSGIE